MPLETKLFLRAPLGLPSLYWLPPKDRNPLLDDHVLTAQEKWLIAPLSGFGHPRPGFAARGRTRLLQHRCGE